MSGSDKPLSDLHDEVVQLLLARVRSGEASAADVANALKLLKDNGINADARKSPLLGALAGRVLPQLPDDLEDDIEGYPSH